MDLRRTARLTEELFSYMGSRHFDLRARGSIVLPGCERQNKLTGT